MQVMMRECSRKCPPRPSMSPYVPLWPYDWVPDGAAGIHDLLVFGKNPANSRAQGALATQDLEVPFMLKTDRIIRRKTVLERTGLSRSTLYRKIAEGTFPRQVKISIHSAGWHESAVNRWIADPAAWRPDNDNPSHGPSHGITGHGEG